MTARSAAKVVRLQHADRIDPAVDLDVDRAAQSFEALDDFDDWGRHPGTVRQARRLAALRWHVAIGGLQTLRPLRSALIVCNARSLAMSPVLIALELADRLDRTVRFVGVPELAPVGTVLRRAGAIIGHPDEVATALRGGDLVVLGAASGRGPLLSSTLHAGPMSFPYAQMAAQERAIVVPAAVISSPFSRSARIEFGEPISAPRRRSAVLAGAQLAEATVQATQALLDRSMPPGLATITSRGLL